MIFMDIHVGGKIPDEVLAGGAQGPSESGSRALSVLRRMPGPGPRHRQGTLEPRGPGRRPGVFQYRGRVTRTAAVIHSGSEPESLPQPVRAGRAFRRRRRTRRTVPPPGITDAAPRLARRRRLGPSAASGAGRLRGPAQISSSTTFGPANGARGSVGVGTTTRVDRDVSTFRPGSGPRPFGPRPDSEVRVCLVTCYRALMSRHGGDIWCQARPRAQDPGRVPAQPPCASVDKFKLRTAGVSPDEQGVAKRPPRHASVVRSDERADPLLHCRALDPPGVDGVQLQRTGR